MGTTEHRPNWIARIAAFLMLLTLATTQLLTGLYANYAVVASDSDSARVAAFKVTTAFGTTPTTGVNLGTMTPGTTAQYVFTVTNDSEVVVQNIISFHATDNLPLAFQLNGKAIANGDVVTNAALARGKTETNTLTVTWDAEEISPGYAGEIDALWFTVKSQQID